MSNFPQLVPALTAVATPSGAIATSATLDSSLSTNFVPNQSFSAVVGNGTMAFYANVPVSLNSALATSLINAGLGSS